VNRPTADAIAKRSVLVADDSTGLVFSGVDQKGLGVSFATPSFLELRSSHLNAARNISQSGILIMHQRGVVVVADESVCPPDVIPVYLDQVRIRTMSS
jgi:hypothetical protein